MEYKYEYNNILQLRLIRKMVLRGLKQIIDMKKASTACTCLEKFF